ncbi:hypothetical protein [Dongia sp.]|uniref:hypothetical protein n=1 Tax=Dongia sp. TaxID=1977262 RepID=UPI0037515C82
MSESTPETRAPMHPYLVLLIAALAPGSGHWAVGNVQRGVMFAWFMFILGWITWRITGPEVSPIGKLSGGLIIYAVSVLDAYRIARFRWTRFHAGRGTGA